MKENRHLTNKTYKNLHYVFIEKVHPLIKMCIIFIIAMIISTTIICIISGNLSSIYYIIPSWNFATKQNNDISNQVKDYLYINKNELEDLLEENNIANQQSNKNVGYNNDMITQIRFADNTNKSSTIHIDDEDYTEGHSIQSNNHNEQFIPPTTYVKGNLVSDIHLTTSSQNRNSQLIVVQITDNGNLPNKSIKSLTNCKVLCNGYGDLLTKQALLTAHSLVCIGDNNILTPIEGIVVEDNSDGIKGEIIEVNDKYYQQFMSILQNLITIYNINKLNYINSESEQERLVNHNKLNKSGDLLIEYFLNKMDTISPKIYVPRGKMVSIIFTKGMYIK